MSSTGLNAQVSCQALGAARYGEQVLCYFEKGSNCGVPDMREATREDVAPLVFKLGSFGEALALCGGPLAATAATAVGARVKV